jgi:hypothetical protein
MSAEQEPKVRVFPPGRIPSAREQQAIDCRNNPMPGSIHVSTCPDLGPVRKLGDNGEQPSPAPKPKES